MSDLESSRRVDRTGAEMLRPSRGVVARDIGAAAVLIQLETNRIFELNVTGARLWSMLEQGLDRNAMCARLRDEFETNGDDVERTVDELVTALAAEGLIDG